MASNYEEERLRKFETGAIRDTNEGKIDYEGHLDPLVIKTYGEYMHKHRFCPDGSIRDSDNWKLGIPKDAYMKSLLRHTHDAWMEHRGYESREGLKDALCAVIFNGMGYLLEVLKDERKAERKQECPTERTKGQASISDGEKYATM